MAEMVVSGVSTRKVTKLWKHFAVHPIQNPWYPKSVRNSISQSMNSVIRLTKPYPFLCVDATYLKVRENHRIVSKPFMITIATNTNGKREVIGFDVYDNERNDTWFMFMESLKKRGLTGLKMITSDAHPGIIYAISKTYPAVAWKRCQTHFSRNIIDRTPKKYKKGLQSELLEMYNVRKIEEVRRIRDRIIDDYSDVAPEAMECLDNGFESVMTVMAIPESIRRFHRTSNHIERINREIKLRSDVIGVFPNVESIIRPMGSVLMDLHETLLTQKSTGYSRSAIASLDFCASKLAKIAYEQQKLLAA